MKSQLLLNSVFIFNLLGRLKLLFLKSSHLSFFPNQFSHFANILTTVNLLQWCHLQNFPISRKPVPPSPVITGDSLQISCGQTAEEALAKTSVVCVSVHLTLCVCVF